MKISIIGAGNVATQLALALRKAGHSIVQICNRSNDAGEELAKTVGATFTSNFKGLEDADVYIIAVKDDAISDVASQLKLKGKIVVHTSGTKTAEILIMPGETQTLKWVPEKTGVYPFYCTDFCSALHQEMSGYLRVSPAGSNVPLTFSLGKQGTEAAETPPAK